jgi:hypothetical protein
MAEKRNVIRLKKRITIRFGIDASTKIAFTEDISPDGLFIKTITPLPPGTRIKVELTMPDSNIVLLEGKIRWRKSGPHQATHLMKKLGMGVKILKFLSGEEYYKSLIDEYKNKSGPD